MFERFWQWVQGIFDKKETSVNTETQNKNQEYVLSYENTRDINFTAIFANRLAMLSVSDSTVGIEKKNKRAELLSAALQEVWGKIKKITASALGSGGCLIVPYVADGKIYFNTVKQNRLIINSKKGESITDAIILADSTVINNSTYYRLVNYKLEGDILYIINRTVTSYGSPASVAEWQNIADIAISNVKKMPFAFLKSPIDNRKDEDEYGVPITYGNDKTIQRILECLNQEDKEFDLKKVRLQLDDRLFTKDPKTGKPVIKDDLFMAGHSDKGELFNVFDPSFRDASFHSRLEVLFSILEKEIGTSKGILTAPETHGATATEIKEALKDTFSIISDVRKSIEEALTDYLYACDILANYYNLSPPGEYELSFDWSCSMLESSSESWMQMKDLHSIGGMSKAELRAWQTGEKSEEAQKAVEEIAAKEPTVKTLLGMSE